MDECLRPRAPALQILGCVCLLHELQEVANFGREHDVDLMGGGEKEFPAHVDEVHSAGGELSMEFAFEGDGIFREEERVDVERKRNRSVTEFTNTVQRVEAARQADFDHVVSERAAIRNHVDISGPDVGRSIVVNAIASSIEATLACRRTGGF